MRYRSIPAPPVHAGDYLNLYDNTNTPRYAYVYAESAELESTGRYGYPDFPPDRNIGGSFFLRKATSQCEGAGVGTICGSGAYSKHHYTGKVYSEWVGGGTPGAYWPPNIDGSAWGADAYNRMKPTKPIFEGGNAIWEFREVPGQLRQRLEKSGLKNIANYWLALKFGWQPLLSDIRSMLSFHQKAEKRLQWLLRHNGKPVRRRVTLVDDTSNPTMTENIFGSSQPGFVNQFYLETPTWRRTEIISDKVWASARFRFWLPECPRNVDMDARLYGLYLSPQFCWNALPWSWLADWFSNAGSILENLDVGVADRLAADYMYVMRTKLYTLQHTNTLKLQTLDGSPVPVSVTSLQQSAISTRLAGDPFGFSTSQNSLTNTQLSILGALGLSRLR
jgi:hypothetical protein